MTIDEVVWLICMFKKVKPAMIPWENIREAGEDRAEAEGVEEVVCVTLQRAPGRNRGPGAGCAGRCCSS